MTLRTPRRRISPRTKRRLQAIKNFFRRTVGSTSQEYTNTSNASVEVSVTELKSKIDLLEQQLNQVSKHCQDLANFENALPKQPHILTRDFSRDRHSQEFETIKNTDRSKKDLKTVETQLLYRDSSKQKYDWDKRFNTVSRKKLEDQTDMRLLDPPCSKTINNVQTKPRNVNCKKSYDYYEPFKERAKGTDKCNAMTYMYSTSSFHSLAGPTINKNEIPSYSGHRKKKYHEKDYGDKIVTKHNLPVYDKRYQKYEISRKERRKHNQVDEDFIADIIKRQYQPVKLFGKRHSDFSQFSVPICRDYEFNMRRDVQEGSELCSCCFNDNRRHKHRYVRNSDVSDMRSICDTRLYSSKRHRRRSMRHMDDYNNERLYDLVPVKEKSSPKSRRKFAEENNYSCKEIPPSPKTHRPKLNLKVQNYLAFENHRKNINSKDLQMHTNSEKIFNRYQSDFSVESYTNKKNTENLLHVNTSSKSAQIDEEKETMSIVQNTNFNNYQSNVFKDTTLNTQTTDLTTDKTDKTLVEIKDILQSFLVEMKKESNVGKYNENEDKNINDQEKDNRKSNKALSSGHNFNYNMGQCSPPPFLPAFPNPCCYPIIPMNMCPMTSLPNGYIVQNPSLTCTACAKHSKENTCYEKDCCNNKSKSSHDINTNTETRELIKEIHKFVSQNPKSVRRVDDNFNENKFDRASDRRKNEKKIVTNRSVGGSNKSFRHDANVGTPNMKCISKSCEAFGSRMQSELYNTTNASYSDTILEKLSLEATESTTESDMSSDTPVIKQKKCKFTKLMRTLKLFKKKKDVIEVLGEDRILDNVQKRKPPFQQQITNYVMHGQEYYQTPPVVKQQHHFCPTHSSPIPYDQRNINQKHRSPNEFCDQQGHYCTPISPAHYNPTNCFPSPFCSHCDPRYNQIQNPQVPLCLKEIEVKSIGTQSVRKMSIFRKFTKNKQPEIHDTTQQYSPPIPTNKTNLWKNFQEKAKQQNTDPLAFSLKTQKQLAQGDMKLRNVMLKKLFYKRNPFSPRNLIVRTLLGKDKSSFGNPPKMYKPRMFL